MSTRIAVAGKGGSGKTTVAATLARTLARRGLRVTAIDDDPNPNLAVALGVPAAGRATLRRVPRDVLVSRPAAPVDGSAESAESAASDEPVFELSRPFSEIVAQYGVQAPDGVATVIMTGVEEAGSG